MTASIYLAGDYNAYTQDVLSRGAVAGFEDLNQASTDATLSKWHPEISSTPSNQDNEYVPEEGTLAEYTWPEGGALEEWVADEQLPAPEFSQAVDENERDTVFKGVLGMSPAFID